MGQCYCYQCKGIIGSFIQYEKLIMPFKLIMCLLSFACASAIVIIGFFTNPKIGAILNVFLFMFLSVNGWFWHRSKA